MTLIDFDKKDLTSIVHYNIHAELHTDDGELYIRLTKLMEKVSKTRSMCVLSEK